MFQKYSDESDLYKQVQRLMSHFTLSISALPNSPVVLLVGVLIDLGFGIVACTSLAGLPPKSFHFG
jgi:hypothetical protein